MTNNPYSCANHKLDFACLGCIKAWIARHDKMLEFIRELAFGCYEKISDGYHEGFVDAQNEIAQEATDLLNEIGKNNG